MNPNRLHHALVLSLLVGACSSPSATQNGDASETDTPATSTTSGGTDRPDPGGSTSGSETGADETMSTTSDSTGAPGDDTSSDGSSTGSTGDPDPVGCEDELECTPPAPAGWSGPTVVHRGSEPPPDCPEAFPTTAFEAHDELAAADATCACACGEAAGYTCSTIVRENLSSCMQVHPGASWTIESGDCLNISTASSIFRSGVPTLDTSGAACPSVATETVPDASFASTIKGCEPSRSPATCDGDGMCLPSASDAFAEMCVHTNGDVACPAGPYTERSVVYTDIEDTRGCSDCTCGTPEGSCDGAVGFWNSCDGVLFVNYATADVGTCVSMHPDIPGGARYEADPDVSCTPGGGQPQGEALPAGPVTVCCLP